ncbi:MAG: PilN domain-containing protein [Patescibacteria group bacterium]|nr:PilN domain-containing protein [Patescibacteria group bacterium]
MINLLPPQQKEELKKEQNYKLVLILGILILFFLICLILILFSIKIYISGKVESMQILIDLEEERFETSKIKELQKKINLANQNISELKNFYQNQKNIVEILEKISEPLPPGIYLTTLSWQKANSQISLSGFSPSREILFKFKENLEGKKEFTEIYFPSSTWVKPINIDFHTNFKVK